MGSKFDLAAKRSNVNVGPSFCNFGRAPVPEDLFKGKAQGLIWFWRRRFLNVFYHIWAWQPSWSMDRDHFSNRSPSLRTLHMKFEQHWPRGFRGEVVWNSQHFSHTNVWCPYNCIGKQTWPRRKKVKRQHTTIILIILVDLPSLMFCAKIHPRGILDSGEE